MPQPESEQLSPAMQTAMVFAARYTHPRSTGGAMVAVNAIMECWDRLSSATQKMILRESYEATTHSEDWEGLRRFAATRPQ